MFTIEVEKKDKDENFALNSLKMRHKECYGGVIEFDENKDVSSIFYDESFYRFVFSFNCKRCQQTVAILRDKKTIKEIPFKIALTAMDGEERQLSDDICIIQIL